MPPAQYKYLFTVACVCCNSKEAIEDLFDSLAEQTLDFSKYIQVIIIDDASDANVSIAAEKFAAEYPDNVIYSKQENIERASAFNFSMDCAEGEWITFTKSEDFVDNDYFEKVKIFLDENKFEGPIIACNMLMASGKNNEFLNNHPLKFKFEKGSQIIDLEKQPQYIQMSASSSFVRIETIRAGKVCFSDRAGALFEGAHFLNKILIFSKIRTIAYLKNATYFCRDKSTEENSTSLYWDNAKTYTEQLYFGSFDLIQYSKKMLKSVAAFIQNAIIYNASWYVERLLENRIPCCLSAAEFDKFMDIMRLIFSHIDPKSVIFSQLPLPAFRTRVAMLYGFQGIDLAETPFFVQEISSDSNSIQLIHYSGKRNKISFSDNDVELAPLWKKDIIHSCNGYDFCLEQIIWLPFCADTSIECRVNDQPVQIISRSSCSDIIKKDELLRAFYFPEELLPEKELKIKEKSTDPLLEKDFRGCWVLMDRVHKADDNAEHFYRWLANKPDFSKKIYFILDAKSPDWDRLAREGFKLLAYKSDEHKIALWNAEWLISSHADIAVRDPMGIRDVTGQPRYKFAFLRHGITKDDMSGWLNTVRLDMLVTSTKREYEYLTAGPYKFSEREVSLTGISRHDRLLEKARTAPKAKNILLCPTWRWHLKASEAFSGEPSPAEIERYSKSDFFRGWNRLLSSPRLADIAKEYGRKVLLLPHPEVERFIGCYTTIPEITRIAYRDVKAIQDLILSCSMLVTDYSSMAMEFAYLGRPVFYYQFPESPWFYGGNVIRPGYFRYPEDGFGPVLDNHERLIEGISQCLKRKEAREDIYEQRAQGFFTLRDGKNCSRIFEAIVGRS